jgi:mono/diheme cytochrome c family protein
MPFMRGQERYGTSPAQGSPDAGSEEPLIGFHERKFGVQLVALAAILIVFSGGQASAQTGEADYRHYCASCHGLGGKGRGTWNGTQVPDLTQLRRKNGGKFPFEDVYRVVDGRSKLPWHQRRPDMPYWGQVFQEEEKEPGAKAKVEARIAAIVDYIRSLQEK